MGLKRKGAHGECFGGRKCCADLFSSTRSSSAMAKAYTQERLTSELKGFLGTKELVCTLQHEASRLLSMHTMSK